MKPLCAAPWINMHWRGKRDGSRVKGTWRTCCESMSQEYAVKYWHTPTMEEMWNHPTAVEIRETLAKGEWHPNCQTCKIREIRFGKSRRGSYNKLAEDLNLKYGELGMLDYRPSNLCNLKCRMCSSMHSSLLAEENNEKEYIFDKRKPKDGMIDVVDWSKLKRVKLLGGEPMIMEETLDVLDKVEEHCLLTITTNAYVISKVIEEKLLNCKAQVEFNLSIDGIKDTYNYIRVNSNWNKVEKNVLRLRDYGKFKMRIIPVGMIWNAFGLEETYEWAEANEISTTSQMHWVGQKWNRMGLMLPEHKSQLIGISDDIDTFINENLPNRDELLHTWKNETLKHDQKRGTDIRKLDERFSAYL